MRVTDEMVEAAQKQLGFSPADGVRLRAALEAALAVGGTPKVKALEWREARISNERGRYTAVSVFGDYEALEWSNGGFGGITPANATDEGAAVTEFDATSMDEAKAAAQADYEKRVLSCLEYTTLPGIREALETVKKMKAIIASCQWYWPEDDTSSEMCADSGYEALVERAELEPGHVAAYARGGIVERRFFGWLPAADDADSDDEFEVDEATETEAVAKLEAEKARRAALRGQS